MRDYRLRLVRLEGGEQGLPTGARDAMQVLGEGAVSFGGGQVEGVGVVSVVRDPPAYCVGVGVLGASGFGGQKFSGADGVSGAFRPGLRIGAGLCDSFSDGGFDARKQQAVVASAGVRAAAGGRRSWWMRASSAFFTSAVLNGSGA